MDYSGRGPRRGWDVWESIIIFIFQEYDLNKGKKQLGLVSWHRICLCIYAWKG